MNDKLMKDEYYNFRSGGGEVSGSIYPGYKVQIVRECIICGKEIAIYGDHVCTDGSDLVCSDCKEAILWAKKKMKEQLK